MLLKNLSLFLAVSMVLVAYWLHEPIPEEIEEKNILRITIAILKIIKVASSISAAIGIDSSINTFTSLCKNVMVHIPSDDTIEIIDDQFDGVPVRIYRPVQKEETTKELPGLVYFRGGGFATLDIDFYHSLIYSIANETGFIVIAVEFRRPPEHKFPIPFDDCLTATVHLLRNGAEYGVDVNRIAIIGESTGGNLAAAVVQRLAVETAFPSLKAQVLMYPFLQAFDFMTPSMITRELPGYLTRQLVIENWLLYYQGNNSGIEKFLSNTHTGPLLKASEYGDAVDHSLLPEKFQKELPEKPQKNFGDEKMSDTFEPTLLNPYYSPLLALNLEKLPVTMMITAEYDVLRDDGFMYAKRLTQAGVTVKHEHFEHSFHGFISLMGTSSQQEAMTILRKFLLENL